MRYFTIIAAIFTGELLLKNHVERTWQEGQNRPFFRRAFLLRRYHNKGACLNLGERRRSVVAAVSVLLTAALTAVFLFTLTRKGGAWLRTALSLLLGGAYSNTYDRLKRKYVVDYFSFNVKWEPLRRIVFNLSDFCILVGALALAFGGSAGGSRQVSEAGR